MGNKINAREIKQIELDILNQFVKVCEQNKLRYYLTAGTLIGAVRHNGFIPWDDDIDVSMPRPDYELLKKIMGNHVFNNQYQLLTWEKKGTDYNFIKMVNVNTIVHEKYVERDTGVWIDIFPIDGLPESYLLTRLLCFKLDFFRKLLFVSISRKDSQEKCLKNKLKNILRPFVQKIPAEVLCRKINHVFLRYDYDSCKFVGEVSGGFSYKARIEKDAYEEEVGLFEGYRYIVPKGRDKLLKQLYGDYMTLPPEEKRESHTFEAEWKINLEEYNY